jgi:hypothetical protein
MRGVLARLWLGGGAAGIALALGCSHGEQVCPTCGGGHGAHVTRVTAAGGTPVLVRDGPLPQPVPVSTYHVLPPPQRIRTEPAVLAREPEPAHVTLKPEVKVEQAEWQVVASPSHKDTGRRSFTDLTAHPAFAHAPDYGWLVGRLEYVHLTKTWCLRYASVDEEDRHGGGVTLVDERGLVDGKAGRLVRVEGQLVSPETREPHPPYRVRSLSVLEGP